MLKYVRSYFDYEWLSEIINEKDIAVVIKNHLGDIVYINLYSQEANNYITYTDSNEFDHYFKKSRYSALSKKEDYEVLYFLKSDSDTKRSLELTLIGDGYKQDIKNMAIWNAEKCRQQFDLYDKNSSVKDLIYCLYNYIENSYPISYIDNMFYETWKSIENKKM